MRIEQDWVWYRSKGKLSSQIKVWGDIGLCSREHTPSPPLIGRGRASSQDAGLQGGGAVLAFLHLHVAQFHPHLALQCLAQLLRMACWAWMCVQLFHMRNSGLKWSVQGPLHTTPMSKWHYTQHKEGGGNVRPYFLPRFYFYFSGIVNGLCRWHFHFCPKLCLKFCSKTPFLVSVGMAPKT